MCGRVGDKAQHRGGEVREIKVNRQRVRERRLETGGLTERERERQKKADREIHDLSL